jgi:hypothetical protein
VTPNIKFLLGCHSLTVCRRKSSHNTEGSSVALRTLFSGAAAVGFRPMVLFRWSWPSSLLQWCVGTLSLEASLARGMIEEHASTCHRISQVAASRNRLLTFPKTLQMPQVCGATCSWAIGLLGNGTIARVNTFFWGVGATGVSWGCSTSRATRDTLQLGHQRDVENHWHAGGSNVKCSRGLNILTPYYGTTFFGK